MKIKKLLPIVVCSFLTLAGCQRGGPNNSQPDESLSVDESGNIVFDNVKITYGNPITGSDGAYMRNLVSMFNKEYKGKIEVQESYLIEKSYYESLELTIPMNRAYDIALVHSYKVAAYANKGLLRPLNNALETSGIDIKREDYLTNAYDASVFNNDQYAIPLDVHSTLLYYNKDLLDKEGLKVPTNRAELLAACAKMQNTPGGIYGLPLSIEWPSEYIYATAFYQNGGKDFDAQENPGFYSDAGKKALSSITDIIHKYKYSPTDVNVDGDLQMFCAGKALFHIQGDWMLQTIKDSGVNFGVTSLSNMFVDESTETSDDIYARSHVFAIPTNSRMTTIKEQACLTFIKYVTEHSDVWAQSGHVPANNSARDTDAYKELPYHSSFGDLNNYRLNDIYPYYYEGFSPVFSRVTTAMSKSDYDAEALLKAAYEEGLDNIATAKG